MALVDYTSYQDVRAALGVSEDELADETLALDVYAYALVVELEELNLNLPADYVTLKDNEARTATEERVYQAVRLFSTYAVAVQLCTSLPLFSPKDVTDGKAAFGRYADSPYKQVIKTCKEQYDRFRAILDTRYSDYKSSGVVAVVRPFMVIATPTTDPVTG